MLRPDTQYTLANGIHLAYQVVGEGERDVVYVAEARTPIDLLWDDPLAALGLRQLAGCGRLITCDVRGWGASDPVDLNALPAMQAWMDDIVAVMDAAGSESAAVVAASEAALPVMLLAATHPDRVSSLALINPWARYLRGPGYPFGLPRESGARLVEAYRAASGRGSIADRMAPSRAREPGFRRWYARSERLGGSPNTVASIFNLYMSTDLTGIVPSIRAPTLVVRRTGDPHVRDGHARWLVDHLPAGRLVELPGDDHLWFSGDTEALMNEVVRFLGGAGTGATGDRMLATVLFSDIVGSTTRAARLGDAAWTSMLQAHDEIVRRHVEGFRGRWIKSTGDGVLATFDGPARAIHCACGMRDALAAEGIDVRAGVHTGEIQLVGDDVAGMAVHVAARIAALAGEGEVLASGSVPPLVAGSGIRFTDRGRHELKGVPEPWPVLAADA
jgi:class 3 adenylate cyclase